LSQDPLDELLKDISEVPITATISYDPKEFFRHFGYPFDPPRDTNFHDVADYGFAILQASLAYHPRLECNGNSVENVTALVGGLRTWMLEKGIPWRNDAYDEPTVVFSCSSFEPLADRRRNTKLFQSLGLMMFSGNRFEWTYPEAI